jgi:pimeloyl-ACP methyl ester carboxylesterase
VTAWRRARRATVTAAAAALVAALGCEPLTLDPFFYSPAPAPAGGYQLSTAIIPRFEELFVETRDGERLHLVHVPAGGAPAHPRTLVYLHGQNQNIGKSWARVELLFRTGHEIYVLDPRGYGRSTGTPSERGLQIDLSDLHGFLTGSRGVPAERLVYYGRSLGGALAIHLASVAPPAALITESTFTSVAALVRDSAYVDLPAGLVSASVWDNLGKLRTIAAPFLILHGTADDYVQFRYATELAAAHPGHHELVAVPGADHGNLPEVMGLAEYAARVAGFLETAAALPPAR